MNDLVMHTGKWRGSRIFEMPSNYLKWLVDNWEGEDIQEAAEEEMSRRTDETEHWYD